MTFSVQCEATGLEYRGADLNGLFAQRKNFFRLNHWRMLRDMVQFNRRAVESLESLDDRMTIEEYFKREKYSKEFLEHYFLPMGSAVWSCPRGTFSQFPIRFILEFYRNHGLLSLTDRPQWRVIKGGSQTYVRALVKQLKGRILTKTNVDRIERNEFGVTIHARGEASQFDHVIFACHSDQALKILGTEATRSEREVLEHFPYEENIAVLHTDPQVLPRSQRAWAAWNYYLPAATDRKATVTYDMNILQGIHAKDEFCVTLNGEERIRPEHVIKRIVYHHPVFTTGRTAAQSRHRELCLQNSTSYCGAYWGNGFHEDGVKSALAVCQFLEPDRCKVVSTMDGSGIADSSRLSTSSAIVCS